MNTHFESPSMANAINKTMKRNTTSKRPDLDTLRLISEHPEFGPALRLIKFKIPKMLNYQSFVDFTMEAFEDFVKRMIQSLAKIFKSLPKLEAIRVSHIHFPDEVAVVYSTRLFSRPLR